MRVSPDFDGGIAMAKRLLVLAHTAQYSTLLELYLAPEEGRVDVETTHCGEAVIHNF